jgi:pilus assembly protein CpaF
MAVPSQAAQQRGQSAQQRGVDGGNTSFEDLKTLIHGKLVEKLDLSRLGDLEGETLRREIRLVV